MGIVAPTRYGRWKHIDTWRWNLVMRNRRDPVRRILKLWTRPADRAANHVPHDHAVNALAGSAEPRRELL